MPIKNTQTTYGLVAKLFHWLLFMLLLGAIVAGNIDAAMPDGPEKYDAIMLHKAMGLLILLLVSVRLGWRLLNPLPHTLVRGWQAVAAVWAHRGLYLLMFAQPLSGLLMSQSAGYPVSFFGLFEVPNLVAEDKILAKQLHEVHEVIWVMLALIALLHISAALYHHFIEKDDVLRRMGFGQVDAD